MMLTNYLQEKLAKGEVALGTQIAQLRSPEVIKVLAAAGVDWVFLDGEHGGLDLETLQDQCRAAAQTRLTPLVRVAELQYHLIARALDCGAQGVIFPRVEDPAMLRTALQWTKFPPVGVRGFGLSPHQIGYTGATIPQMIEYYNTHLLNILQIETVLAVERCDELLSAPGLDIVMVGPVDLSISLGVPGDFLHPKMLAAIGRVQESCAQHGLVPGIQVRNRELAGYWRQHGMRFLGCASDTALLHESAAAMVTALR